jgi:hypothetical protein
MSKTLFFQRSAAVSFVLVALLGASCAGSPTHEDSVTPTGSDGAAGPSSSTGARQELKTIPAGTVLSVRLDQTVSTSQSQVGDALSGRLAEPVMVGGDVVLGSSAVLRGRVLESAPAPKIGGKARLNLVFDSIDDQPITATYYSEGKGQTKKDAATIGGATAGGAVLGRVIGHEKGEEARGTAIGAVVGAAVGTAVAATNKAQAVTIPAGSVIQIVLETPVTVA